MTITMIEAWGVALVGRRLIVAPQGFDSEGGVLRDTVVTCDEAIAIGRELEAVQLDRDAPWPTVQALTSRLLSSAQPRSTTVTSDTYWADRCDSASTREQRRRFASRDEAHRWLADSLGVDPRDLHQVDRSSSAGTILRYEVVMGEDIVGEIGSDVVEPAAGPRIRRLELRADVRATALTALQDALRPYGSITGEVAPLMLDWVSGSAPQGWDGAGPAHQLDVAHRLLAAIRDVECDDCSDLTLGTFDCSVRTPSSGTLIEVRRYSGGWSVTIDFRERGSLHRAMPLIESGMAWDVEHCEAGETVSSDA